ncbi:uncharacterized protein BDR25DRAFT_226664 [Lindgomyces ingoldianus]|uniref:Uncharacterized protein n=1 Tax=Lindgomyces ingoldianus TaxID=673940 RepID=A0ACB6QVR6_9PLEO|nr:uncharacterized protein BDR25DRAFT_226664 [Lindgomyces ingoldianus]KAF2470180.1 hypothetical protein BDR25DRAFT_226664 [Lindgomyces ingoldianus]
MLSKILLLTATALTSVSALGNAVVSNQCPYDIYLWSVDQQTNPLSGTLIPARTLYTEPFRTPCPGCGISLKISTTSSLVGGHMTQFEYAIDTGLIYYDISFVDCAVGQSADNCPGHEKGLRIDSAEPSCLPLNCPSGTYCVNDAYYVDDPNVKLGIPAPVKTCARDMLGMDLVFRVCGDEAPL